MPLVYTKQVPVSACLVALDNLYISVFQKNGMFNW